MDYLKAFLMGGLLCLIGQILIDKTKLTPARILVSYVVIGVLLGAAGLYKPFAEFAGAGASVPLTGFGNTLAKGVREAVDRDGFLGIFTAMCYNDSRNHSGGNRHARNHLFFHHQSDRRPLH